MIEIKNRYTNEVLYVSQCETLKQALIEAAKAKKVLTEAYLTEAYLTEAYLTEAYLTEADLTKADLRGADLRGADLRGAYLTEAYLTEADLTKADLTKADLRGANLRGADLRGAYLTEANLTEIKSDYFRRLSLQKAEVPYLYRSLVDGKINGSVYEGDCCCFVGTIAKAAEVRFDCLPELKPDSLSLTEKFFLGLRPGDTPENHPISKILAEWTKEFLIENGKKVPERKVVWD